MHHHEWAEGTQFSNLSNKLAMLEPPQSGREAVGREGKAGVGQPYRRM